MRYNQNGDVIKLCWVEQVSQVSSCGLITFTLHSHWFAVFGKMLILDFLILAGGFLLISPSLRRWLWPQSNSTHVIYFHAGLLPVTYITLHCHPLKWASLSPSPASSGLHLHLIIKRLLLYHLVLCFRTPSGVFTMTCIISLCAWGAYSKLTWPRDHSTGCCVKGGDNSQLQLMKSNHMRWNLFSNHRQGREHLLLPLPPLNICRTLPSCCCVYGLPSVMAFSKTARNSSWLARSSAAPW